MLLWCGLDITFDLVVVFCFVFLFQHIMKTCLSMEVKAEVQSQVKFDLKNTYRCHKKKSLDVEVDFIRFTFKNDKENFFQKLKHLY